MKLFFLVCTCGITLASSLVISFQNTMDQHHLGLDLKLVDMRTSLIISHCIMAVKYVYNQSIKNHTMIKTG